jgi:rod shape-determining protein MreD
VIKLPGRGVIFTSLILALILQILPVPSAVEAFRPDWVLACVVYWNIALPHRANIGTAFACGVMLDALLGSTIGSHAMAMTVVAYIAVANYSKLRNFSVWQQALVVGSLVMASKLSVYWAEFMVKDVKINSTYFYQVFTTILIWPWIFLILRKVRRQFRLK